MWSRAFSAQVALWLKIWLQCGRCGFNHWVGKIPWSRKWQPIPLFLPGTFHGQRSLVDYSPWGHKSWTWLSNSALPGVPVCMVNSVVNRPIANYQRLFVQHACPFYVELLVRRGGWADGQCKGQSTVPFWKTVHTVYPDSLLWKAPFIYYNLLLKRKFSEELWEANQQSQAMRLFRLIPFSRKLLGNNCQETVLSDQWGMLEAWSVKPGCEAWMSFPVVLLVKMWEMPVWSLGREDPLEEGLATHSMGCLENPMDRGTWPAVVRGVAESDRPEAT